MEDHGTETRWFQIWEAKQSSTRFGYDDPGENAVMVRALGFSAALGTGVFVTAPPM